MNVHDEARRLGKAELGRHAFEQRMPDRISKLIANEDDSNRLKHVIPMLAAYLEQDDSVASAVLCNPKAVQISKLPDEGNHFCAYRNIQMQLALLDIDLSIPGIQVTIESAWDAGINTHGRIETGGIIGTRKHIGTSEAQAHFQKLSIATTARVFSGKDANKQLLDYVETHFIEAPGQKVTTTTAPPIFLQRPGHSLTIVGHERSRNGHRRLLVFDPGWAPPSSARAYTSGTRTRLPSSFGMRSYRRSEASLGKYTSFETLTTAYETTMKRNNA